VAGPESSMIAEKDEHCAGHYPGGGADKRQFYRVAATPSRVWTASKSFGFETGPLPDRRSNLPRALFKPSFAQREAPRPRFATALPQRTFNIWG
jgi:hypothetical protein